MIQKIYLLIPRLITFIVFIICFTFIYSIFLDKSKTRKYVLFAGNMMCKIFNIHVTINGKLSEDSKILLLTPHSNILDILVVVKLGVPCFVSKIENKQIFKPFNKYIQPIYIDFSSKESKKEAIREITRRSENEKIIIFPQGRISKARFNFKDGAFIARKPIQVIHIKSDNIPTTDASLFSFINQLSLYEQNIEINILDTYYPSKDELNNVQLFKKNVIKYIKQNTS